MANIDMFLTEIPDLHFFFRLEAKNSEIYDKYVILQSFSLIL